MRIYAACLASYNNGVLHGRWIDASADANAMQEEVNAMLRESRFPNVTVTHPETGKTVWSAEEFAIHDMEGLPSSFGEYTSLQEIADYVELVEEFGHIDEDDMAAIFADFRSIDETREALQDRFAGIYESFRHYADDAADEMLNNHDIKDDSPLARYFDYESFARDLKCDVHTIDTPSGVAVFYA
jgi:antirestriction protein